MAFSSNTIGMVKNNFVLKETGNWAADVAGVSWT